MLLSLDFLLVGLLKSCTLIYRHTDICIRALRCFNSHVESQSRRVSFKNRPISVLMHGFPSLWIIRYVRTSYSINLPSPDCQQLINGTWSMLLRCVHYTVVYVCLLTLTCVWVCMYQPSFSFFPSIFGMIIVCASRCSQTWFETHDWIPPMFVHSIYDVIVLQRNFDIGFS